MELNQDSNDPRYSDGLVKLRTLRALYNNLPGGPRQETVVAPVKTDPPTLEVGIIEKCRDRALTEYNDHQLKAQALHILSDRYRELGLNDVADGYKERGDMENATTRGFQSVIKAYEKKLEDAQFRGFTREEPAGDLECAGQYLESYNSDRKAFDANTLQVLKAEETIEKLLAELANGPSASVEIRQVIEVEDQQDRFIRMAEHEALNAALSYKRFQTEIQAAEKNYRALSLPHETDLEKTGTEDRKSPSRMNKLAVGVVVYQTLKVLDHEL